MWALDFCHRRSSDCMQIAEDCEDAQRRRAWLELAREWVKLSEVVVASNHGKLRRNIFNEPQAQKPSCPQVSEDRAGVLSIGAGGEGPACLQSGLGVSSMRPPTTDREYGGVGRGTGW